MRLKVSSKIYPEYFELWISSWVLAEMEKVKNRVLLISTFDQHETWKRNGIDINQKHFIKYPAIDIDICIKSVYIDQIW